MCAPILAAVRHQLALEKLDGRQRRRDADRIAAEGRCVRAGSPVHHIGASNDCAERHSAGDALGGRDDVRNEPEVLRREHLTRAAHPALHLVGDDQDAVLVGEPAQFVEKSFGWNHIAAFTLDRLDHKCGYVFRGNFMTEKDILDIADALGGACVGRRCRASVAYG